ncbi:PAS domain-containing sensor histidine kinase [Panacibacter sp. DH6]|uniref:histidine kinase n=1 Tax=Panacibacter microcysteis TaxID=2793269 RepID=A0A931GXX4_9BACT|nr:PAS domain-containing sensor histidine kinase [Panacibacter microcysteis]MBG9376829.1 PAS domain-containing sensor histidine kinase [Panacibacter microcysteis]
MTFINSLDYLPHIMEELPIAFSVLEGPDFIVKIANKKNLEIWQRSAAETINRPLFDIFPEVKSQNFKDILTNVYQQGITYNAEDVPAQFIRNGTLDTGYFDIIYQPLKSDNGAVYAIMVISKEVTTKHADVFNKHLLESSPDCVKILDQDGRIAFMNFNGRCAMELEDFDIVKNKYWWELWGDEYQNIILDAVQRAKNGEVVHFEAFCATFKGTPKWWNIIVSPITDKDAHVESIIAVSRDITEKKIAEKKIADNEVQFRTLANSIPQLAWMMQPDGWIYWYNERWYDYTGTTLEQMQGWGWQAIHHPAMVEGVVKRFKEAIDGGNDWEDTFLLRGKDGNYRWFLSRAFPLRNEKGEIMQWFGTNTDITERRSMEEALKENEQRFRLLAENITELIWVTDSNHQLTYINESAYLYFGLVPQSLQNLNADYIHPEDLVKNRKYWEVSQQEEKEWAVEHRLKNKYGEYRWHHTKATPHKNSEGKIIMWIGTCIDIHDHKMKEQQKDEFMSIASHELKTPLTVAKGYIQILSHVLSDSGTRAVQTYTMKALDAIERMQQMIAELLDISKIQNGSLTYFYSRFNFNALLNETIYDFLQHTRSHNISKQGNPAVIVYGDENRMKQVIVNLLSNAVKYSPSSSEVQVCLTVEDSFLHLAVTDYGIGLNAEHLDKIFERYYRIKEQSHVFDGLGIGLYISAQIVEKHGGNIYAESEPGKGSTFHLKLPFETLETD